MTDVVLVVVDAARPDAVGHLDSPGDPTPTIDSLADRGISFPGAYACINTTDPSVTSIETGCYPATMGLYHHGGQVTRAEAAGLSALRTLPEVLSSAGYETGAVDWLGRWHQRGYDHYTGREGYHDYDEGEGDTSPLKPVADAVNARRDLLPGPIYEALKRAYRRFVNPVGDKDAVEDATETTDRAISLFEGMDDPRYLFVHYWDVHAPYDTPEEYVESACVPEFDVDESALHASLSRIENDDRRRYIEEILADGLEPALREYYGAMSYVDDELARLLEHVPDDAYVVVLADHGESLFEHGIFFEHHGLYDVNTRVPLVIAGPDVPAAPTDGFVQLVDVMPTLLGRLDVESDAPVDGIDAFERIEHGEPLRDAVFLEEAQTQRNRAIRTTEYTYIESLDEEPCSYCGVHHGEGEQLYDRREDPGERENVAGDRPEMAADLRDRLRTFLAEGIGLPERRRVRATLDRMVEEGSV